MRRYLVAILLISVLLAGARAEGPSDAERFKEDHEILNGQMTFDGANSYAAIEVPADNRVQYVDLPEILTILSDGTGVLYFGFPECPWCRTLVPVLFEAAREAGYEGPVYYGNFLEARDRRTLDDDGNILVEYEGSPDYQQLLLVLYDWLTPYRGLNDDSLRRVYFPTTVFVKNGQIFNVHLVTVDSQESGYDPLTPEQHAELLSALAEDMRGLAGE